MRDAGQYYGEKQGNLDKALGYFNESWKLNDQDPQTARLMGVALGIKAQMETAKGNAAQALPLNREALGWFQKAIALAPKEASYYFDLGTAYYNLGDRVQANTYHQKAMEMDPKLRQRYEGKK